MPQIQLRRGSAIPSGELYAVGEAMWDDANSRLGVFNNRGGDHQAMEWYPRVVGNKMIMNPQQTLGGMISDGTSENNIYLDFSTQDAIYVRNRNTNAVYAALTAGGATFNAIAAAGAPYNGITNLILNGNLAVRRTAIPITTVDTNVAAYRSSLVAPNWQLWRSTNSSGRLTLSYDSIGSRPYVGCPAVLQVSANSAPNSAGLRCFGHGYEAFDGPMTFSAYIYGPNGAQTSHRAMSENGNILFTKTVTGNGAWQRIVTTFTPQQDGSRWAGFDVLYNPSGNTPSTQVWRVGGAQLQFGTGASGIENRPEAIERALCEGIYREGRVAVVSAVDSPNIPLNNFRYGVKVEAAEVATKQVVISAVDQFGFNVAVPSLVTPSKVTYAAYMMPTVIETA